MKQILTALLYGALALCLLSPLSGCANNSTAQTAALDPVPDLPADGGPLAESIKRTENLVNIRLDGATDATVAEAFGKVVNTAPGVIKAKRYASRIVPDEPQASYSTWRVTIEDTDPFRLQANIIKMVNDILAAGGTLTMNGVPYRYTAAEVDMMKGIRSGDATSRELQFVVDRELARDRELSGRHDPYRARE